MNSNVSPQNDIKTSPRKKSIIPLSSRPTMELVNENRKQPRYPLESRPLSGHKRQKVGFHFAAFVSGSVRDAIPRHYENQRTGVIKKDAAGRWSA